MSLKIHEETMCCGHKRCPVIRIFDDGTVELTDDDVDNGSVGTIRLSREVAERVAELLPRARSE
jgi:hypothetical protein